LINYL